MKTLPDGTNLRVGAGSPWGMIQTTQELGAGVWSITTASHGGIVLDEDRRVEVAEMFPNFKAWVGDGRYLEEDLDWRIAALAFPECFTKDDCGNAIRGAEVDHKSRNYYRIATEWFCSAAAGPVYMRAGMTQPKLAADLAPIPPQPGAGPMLQPADFQA